MNKPPAGLAAAPMESMSTHSSGSTDYSKFERLSRALDSEEKSREFESEQVKAAQWCKLDHIHGPQCRKQPPSCSHDHSDERNIYEKPYDEKLSAIRLFREEGNKLFKVKDFSAAIYAYGRAVIYLDYTFGNGDEQEDELDQERLKCHLNLAASYLEMEALTEAINQCRLAIQIDAHNCKAHYRRGVAYMRKGDLEESQTDLYKAIKLASSEPVDSKRSIDDAIRELNVKWREYRQKSKLIAEAAIN